MKSISDNLSFLLAREEPTIEDEEPTYDIADSPEKLQADLEAGVAELNAMMLDPFADPAELEAKAAALDHMYAAAAYHTTASDALEDQLKELEKLIAQSHVMDPQADLAANIQHLEEQIMNYSKYLTDNNPRAGWSPVDDAAASVNNLTNTHTAHAAHNTEHNPSAMDPTTAVSEMSANLTGTIAAHDVNNDAWKQKMADHLNAQQAEINRQISEEDHAGTQAGIIEQQKLDDAQYAIDSQADLSAAEDALDGQVVDEFGADHNMDVASTDLLRQLGAQAAAAENLELLLLAANSLKNAMN
jgi:Tfp pilus assembly protein PilE